MPNQQLPDELYKPIIKRFKKRKVYSSFKDNVWVADLAAKPDLASLKGKINKLDIDKLTPVPVDLSKLSDVVKMMFLKR